MPSMATLRALFIATDKVSPELKKISKNFKSLEETMSKADFKALKAQFRQIEKSAGEMGGKLAAVGKYAAAGLAAAAGSIAAGVGASVNAFVEYGGAIDDAVNRAGVGAKAFQELAFAAKFSGSSAEAMERALTKLNQGMANAAAGSNKNLEELFAALNIELRDAQGNVRNAADVMPELAKAFQTNENAAVRTRMAMTLFGRAGTELIPMFADLDTHGEKAADGMDAWRKKAERLGLVLSDDQVAAAAELGDQMDLTRAAFAGLANTVGAQVTPVLLELLPQVQNFIAQNREFIGQKVASTFRDIAKAIAAVPWAALVNSVVSTTQKVFSLIDALGGLPRIAAVVGGAFAAVKILTFGAEVAKLTGMIVTFAKTAGTLAQVTKAFGAVGAAVKALGMVIAATPVIGTIALIVAGLTALGFWVYNNWDSIKETFAAGLDYVSEKFDALGAWFTDNFPGLAAAADWAADQIGSAFDVLCSLPAKFMAAWDGVKQWFADLWGGIKSIFSDAVSALTDQLKSVVNALPSFMVPDALLEWAQTPQAQENPAPQGLIRTEQGQKTLQAQPELSLPALSQPVDLNPGAFTAPALPAQTLTVQPELGALQTSGLSLPALSQPVDLSSGAFTAPALPAQTLQIQPELGVLQTPELSDLQIGAQINPVYADAQNPPPPEITQTIKPVYDLSGLDTAAIASMQPVFNAQAAQNRTVASFAPETVRGGRSSVDVSGTIGVNVRAERGLRANTQILQPAGAPVALTANQGAYR